MNNIINIEDIITQIIAGCFVAYFTWLFLSYRERWLAFVGGFSAVIEEQPCKTNKLCIIRYPDNLTEPYVNKYCGLSVLAGESEKQYFKIDHHELPYKQSGIYVELKIGDYIGVYGDIRLVVIFNRSRLIAFNQHIKYDIIISPEGTIKTSNVSKSFWKIRKHCSLSRDV